MRVNKPMEHWDSSRICADCVRSNCEKECMKYSESCERFECIDRICNVSEEQFADVGKKIKEQKND